MRRRLPCRQRLWRLYTARLGLHAYESASLIGMDRPQRPPAPPRSYTETVEDDVQDATSSQLFSRRPLSSRAEIAVTNTLSLRRDGRSTQTRLSDVSVGLAPEQRIGIDDDVGQAQVLPQTAAAGARASVGSHEDYLATRPTQRDAPRLMPENGLLPRAFSTADLLVRDGPDSDNDEADFASDVSCRLAASGTS